QKVRFAGTRFLQIKILKLRKKVSSSIRSAKPLQKEILTNTANGSTNLLLKAFQASKLQLPYLRWNFTSRAAAKILSLMRKNVIFRAKSLTMTVILKKTKSA